MTQTDYTSSYASSIDRDSASYKLKKKLLRKAFDAALYGKGECKYSPPEMIARILEITEETRRDMPEDHKQELAYVRQARQASAGEPPSIFKLNLRCIKQTAQNLEEVKTALLPAAIALKNEDELPPGAVLALTGRIAEILELSDYPSSTQTAIVQSIQEALQDESRSGESIIQAFQPVLSLRPVLRRTIEPENTTPETEQVTVQRPQGPTIH